MTLQCSCSGWHSHRGKVCVLHHIWHTRLPLYLHLRYRWLAFINPNYYGFSSSAFLLLSDFETDCEGTQFECYTSSGQYILAQFDFDEVNPYLHIVVSIGAAEMVMVLLGWWLWLWDGDCVIEMVVLIFDSRSQILMMFATFYLLVATLSNWARSTTVIAKIKRAKAVIT